MKINNLKEMKREQLNQMEDLDLILTKLEKEFDEKLVLVGEMSPNRWLNFIVYKAKNIYFVFDYNDRRNDALLRFKSVLSNTEIQEFEKIEWQANTGCDCTATIDYHTKKLEYLLNNTF